MVDGFGVGSGIELNGAFIHAFDLARDVRKIIGLHY